MRSTLLLLLAACSTASAKPSNRILEAHNRFRAQHCAPPLAWSEELAREAQRWAEKLRKRGCPLEHSETKHGENLAVATTGFIDGEKLVAGWYAEIEKYDFQKAAFSMEAGHFTQVVWVGTKSVGCAMTQCKGLDLYVCNYDPPGNIWGKFKTNVLPRSCRK